ncbi:MAG TPA: site-specific DNA-methyltransferase [Pirellulales bacterium]|nr:site-specific DNA-methyltransferase [Pirellulales bacterium]
MSRNTTATIDDIEQLLGRPFCRGESYAVFQADCLEAMRGLPTGMVDLTITSPPYNIGKEYETPLELDQYVDWCESWLAELYRLTRTDGALWLNLGYIPVSGTAKALPLPYLLWNKSSFYLVQEIVWNYGAGVAGKKFLSPRNEKFLWYVKNEQEYCFNLDSIRDPDVKYPQQKKNGKLRCNTIGKNPSDVWQIAKVTSGEDRSSPERAPHPAQFPLDLVERIVLGFSDEGDMVLDPFMGSGTTADACIRHGRNVVGFEVNVEYCRYVAKRLKRVNEDQRSLLFEA